jgi:hypothetical protein
MLIDPHFTYLGGMEAKVKLVCSGDRSQTSCIHERTCVRVANSLINYLARHVIVHCIEFVIVVTGELDYPSHMHWFFAISVLGLPADHFKYDFSD